MSSYKKTWNDNVTKRKAERKREEERERDLTKLQGYEKWNHILQKDTDGRKKKMSIKSSKIRISIVFHNRT